MKNCVVCGNLLKKAEAANGDTCNKCQRENEKPQLTLVEPTVETPIENIDSNEQAIIKEEIIQEPATEKAQEPNENPPVEPMPTEIPDPIEKKPSVGQQIRDRFQKLIDDSKVTDEILAILTETDKTKETLGIRYAFLKLYNPEQPIKELTYINGHARYTSKPIQINNKEYLITNDLYSKNVEKFIAWCDSL